jgi:hypothetical protein
MRVNYELTAEDWTVFFLHHQEQKRPGRSQWVGGLIRLFLLAAAVVLLVPGSILVRGVATLWEVPPGIDSSHRFWMGWVLTLAYAEAVLLLICGVALWWERKTRRPWLDALVRRSRPERAIRRYVDWCLRTETISLGWRYELSVDVAGVTQFGELSEGEPDAGAMRRYEYRVAWPWVQEIRVTDRHILFVASKPQSFLVPRRAFPTDAAFQEFVDTARQHRSAAQETRITAAIPKSAVGSAAIQEKPPGAL